MHRNTIPPDAKGPKGLTATNVIVIVVTVLLGSGYLSSFFSFDTVAQTDAKEWERYDFSESGFSIELPTRPLKTSSTSVTPLYEEVHTEKYQTSTVNGASYVVQVLTFPKDYKEGFDEFVTRMAEGQSADFTPTTFDGHEAADFTWELNFDGTIIKVKGRVVGVGNVLYMLMAGAVGGHDASDIQYKTFLNSFTLLES